MELWDTVGVICCQELHEALGRGSYYWMLETVFKVQLWADVMCGVSDDETSAQVGSQVGQDSSHSRVQWHVTHNSPLRESARGYAYRWRY